VAVEFDIHIAHAQPVVINQADDDLDSAIDLAIDRATKALRRLHDKVVSHKADSLRDMEVVEN
jgi:putative sigma-54 modulation protein